LFEKETRMSVTIESLGSVVPYGRFTHPDFTDAGENRAQVSQRALSTLWFNTGTLCNIECAHCYIESSPRNDALVYLTTADVEPYLEEIKTGGLPTREIGFTGGEPFLNPDIIPMVGMCLARGYEVLILTNAMQPMQRPMVKEGLLNLKAAHGDQLKFRVSIDHFTAGMHDVERGAGSFVRALEGLDWLAETGFAIAVAGRTRFGEDEVTLRAGFRELFSARGYPVDADDPSQLVLFPEMDEQADVPEITTACWGILDVSPDAMMCAESRMVIRRKGADAPVVLPCTLLPFDPNFEMGRTLTEAATADGGNFECGAVKLNHPHCAKFCVLGGGNCSQ
jgi:uncharacterized Fe-S cluster-containing radical SAM superfamily protein